MNIQKLDTMTGTVIDFNHFGCYVSLDSNETDIPYAFYYGNGKRGDKVLVSIKKIDNVRNRINCDLDCVLEYA